MKSAQRSPGSNRDTSHATYDATYTQYQTNRSAWRQWVRDRYLSVAASYAIGPSLDFGCGAGELLQRLPAGSKGIEYNQASVEHCQSIGLDVAWYDGFADDFSLSNINWQGHARTVYLSHVLEHFSDPVHILKQICCTVAAEAQRIVVITPGLAGFRTDPTHRQHVDPPMLATAVRQMPGWTITTSRHFPFNQAAIGNYFAHNELHTILDKSS